MKAVNFSKIRPGDVVQVPRTQFSQQRWGWNGWLFSEAVVLERRKGKTSGRPIIKVRMCIPAGKNEYRTFDKCFFAEEVFETGSVERAKRFMYEDGYKDGMDLDEFIKDNEIVGAEWVRFLNDEGKLFPKED